MVSQFVQFLIYTLATVVLARLLSPEDYGWVGMVTAVTGILGLIRDSGLSAATVQRETITRELISTVFWINLGLGVMVALFSIAVAPGLARFYGEPKVYGITLALAAAFILDSAGAQHVALLRRQMRFQAIALIDTISLLIAVVASISMALAGFGYWALVATRIATTLTITVAAWMVEPWRPGRPRRGTGAMSMMRFGSYLTGVNLLTYSFRNADNVLIGWYWGAGSLGFYQKAYSLLMLPISQINAPISSVAISALSRLQSEPERLRRYFIGGYSMVASITLPMVVGVTVFSDDIIRCVAGEQWIPSVGIFRLLAPAALIGTLLSPLAWLYISAGRGDRQVRAGLIWTPLMLAAFAVGLKYGPEGVALGYSGMSILLALPLCWYALRGTPVRLRDLAEAIKLPAVAAVVAGAFGYLLKAGLPPGLPAAVSGIGGCLLVLGTYAFVLLVVMRQRVRYRELVRHLFPRRGD